MKYAICRFDHRKKGTLPPNKVRQLAMLVAKNYERRKIGERPDLWHFADVALIEDGYYLREIL